MFIRTHEDAVECLGKIVYWADGDFRRSGVLTGSKLVPAWKKRKEKWLVHIDRVELDPKTLPGFSSAR